MKTKKAGYGVMKTTGKRQRQSNMRRVKIDLVQLNYDNMARLHAVLAG